MYRTRHASLCTLLYVPVCTLLYVTVWTIMLLLVKKQGEERATLRRVLTYKQGEERATLRIVLPLLPKGNRHHSAHTLLGH